MDNEKNKEKVLANNFLTIEEEVEIAEVIGKCYGEVVEDKHYEYK